MNKKLTIKQLLNGLPALQRLGAERYLGGAGIKIAYAIAKNISAVTGEIDFYEKRRVELVKRFEIADMPEDKIPAEVKQRFFEELAELREFEVEIDVRPVVIGEGQPVPAPNDLFALEWMVQLEGCE